MLPEGLEGRTYPPGPHPHLHSRPGGRAPSAASTVHGAKGAEEKVSSHGNAVVVERSGLGPSVCPEGGGGGGLSLVTVPPGGVGHRRTFWGSVQGGGRGRDVRPVG